MTGTRTVLLQRQRNNMMLHDNHDRIISYLRISVTERCNFRCTYCVPIEDENINAQKELLTFEEIERVARVGAKLGLTKIRLTGGEPTVRQSIVELVGNLSKISGIREIAMTTNASRLGELAASLKVAGLHRLNISLDTLQREQMEKLARRPCFDTVMGGIEAATREGFSNLKFNCVVMRGTNENELCDLADFACERGATMRFIEFMPMGNLIEERLKIVSMPEMLKILNRQFDFKPAGNLPSTDPARAFVCQKTGARIGFITSMSDHFCDSCNRMRLTAQGGLRPCLHQNAEVDLRSILQDGRSDEQIIEAFREAANMKWAGHQMNAFVPLYSRKQMIAIGG